LKYEKGNERGRYRRRRNKWLRVYIHYTIVHSTCSAVAKVISTGGEDEKAEL
jgi:hypothetical protein